MPDWLSGSGIEPSVIATRLIAAVAMGAVVAWIHGRTSRANGMGDTFPATLVLLAVLIAMVTQVIGDNVARAFSLVGALSIVRFRTVVRDTRDTAFVIFAVVVGMAAGAQNIWVGVLGLAVGGAAAFALSALNGQTAAADWTPDRVIRIRAAMAVDLEKQVGAALRGRAVQFRLVSVGTLKMGTAIEAEFEVTIAPELASEDLLREIGRIDGVQDVRIERLNGSEER